MQVRLLLISTTLLLTGCVSRRVNVPPFIPPARDATISELIEIVNQRLGMKSLLARTDLQFETAEAAADGILRRYRTASGRVLLARPGHIRLQIEAPVLSVSIAEMASDGERFQLLVYPEEYRAFIEGTNRENYAQETRNLDQDPELMKVGPLVNIRPQHFIDAFFFEEIKVGDPDTQTICEEARPVEDDPTRKEKRIVRSYYVLSDIRRGEQAPRSKYWFDRTRDLRLTRRQVFDSKGLLVGDVTFSNYLPPDPVAGERLPSQIWIQRPYDEYSLRMTLQSDSIVVNRDIPPQAFSLEPPSEWGSSVRRIDLDRKNEH